MNSVSLGKLMDDLATKSFEKRQLDIINKHEMIYDIVIKAEVMFIIIYVASCFYLLNNSNIIVEYSKIVSLLCWIPLSVFVTFNRNILKWKLKKTL